MNDSLPQPDAAAQAHSETLVSRIIDRIGTLGGDISFAEFMQMALYTPGLGYYSGPSQKFGHGGDFTTAPEISALFSQSLAAQCGEVINAMGHADILEVGAGSGTMAAEMLATLKINNCLPDRYFILELSAALRVRQRASIQARVPELLDRVQWIEALPVSGFCGVMVSNELLDALPVEIFCIQQGEVCTRHVAVEEGRFVWLEKPAKQSVVDAVRALEAHLQQPFAEGYCSELNLAARAWISSMAGCLQQGLILQVDYGYPRHEFYHTQRTQGTLMCHYQHRAHSDPLVLVGLQDITAHVDFTAVAEAAEEAGLTVAGFTTQAHFLLSLGIEQRLASLDDINQHMQLAQQLKQLMLPSEMGELFKVIALSKCLDMELQGFGFQDQRSRL